MAQNAHGPLPGSSGPSLVDIRGQRIEAQLPQHHDFTQARLQVRAIVAARRIEDRQREIDDAFALVRKVDDALVDLKQTASTLASVAELADGYSQRAEELLAAACAELPPHHRERLTAIARSMSELGDNIACILKRLSLELAITTEQLDDGGAP